MADRILASAAGNVGGSLFGVIKTEIGYMWNCTQNVETFKNEVEKLQVMKRQVQQNINIANDKGDKLIEGVEEWLNKADDEISKAQVFLQQEANANIGICGNWGTLHHYGKMATKMTPALLEHKASGKDFVTCVSVETRAPGPLVVYQNRNLEDLVTHNLALKAIIAALEDESKQIIGIYGLGGVGKTTLANEVAAKVKNTLFADVAITTVKQNVKVEEIKKDIGEATKRIMKGDKILIILDDVWEKLNLEDLCIPCGNNYMNCKILLTSRSEKVCQHMNAHSKICVNSLPIKEAWILFKRLVGERLETEASLKPVALKVVKECGGLPLLIQAVGNALKHESIKSWEWALTQLQKHAPLDIDEEIRKSFTQLKLSYDYLKSEEVKSCFLLCSLFPEDSYISLEGLVYYMVGLEKFDELESIEDARGRVQNAVNILTSSCLLLNVEDEDEEPSTKMHDVVRDVALLIASEGKNKYLVEAGKDLTEWQPRNKRSESYTGISLMKNRISKLPDYEVHLSSLDIFLLNNNWELSMISDEFIKGMKEVKVLDMGGCRGAQLPQSLKLLTKLCMLNLRGNNFFNNISMLGEMKELEILILNDTGIKEIPREIGQLVNLRRLEVSKCRDMTHVTPGVISKLKRLEELRIEFRWVSKGVSGCIAEVMKLSKLTYLDLKVESLDLIPEVFNSEKLKGFVIQSGYFNPVNKLRRSDRYLIISSERHLVIPLVKWLKKLIEVSRPQIFLHRIENLSNIMPTLCDEGFNKLEHIELWMCSNVSCLVDDESTISCDWDEGKTKEKLFMQLKHLKLLWLHELEVIWKCPDEYISLTNLVSLFIDICPKLVRVFTVCVAQGLVNLKELSIIACNGLEEVIYGGGDDESGNVIVFRSLTKITLSVLPRLKSFINSAAGNCSIKYPCLVDVGICECESMKMWGPGIHETPNLKVVFPTHQISLLGVTYHDEIVLDGPCAINEAVEKAYRKYKDDDDDDEE